MIIENFTPFVGQHCETTTAGTLLNQLGLHYSEPMLFGLGQGLGYLFWKMKTMDFPFIGGRLKPLVPTQNLAANLNLRLDIKETSSQKKAWQNVAHHLDAGKAVGLQLDCYHLEYFNTRIHFAGHFAAMIGYDAANAYLIDTDQQGHNVSTSLDSLAAARNEKGSMSAKNLVYILTHGDKPVDLRQAIPQAITNNAQEFLNPPITNIGYKGILKTSKQIKNWFKNSPDISGDFSTTAMLMERAGTGGSLFRNFYRDFLHEAYEVTGLEPIATAHEQYIGIAQLWADVAALFDRVAETQDVQYINDASEILADLSDREFRAMSLVANLS